MQCPKCSGALAPQVYKDVIAIHRCTDCAGLFCKPEALAEMKREWMAEAVLDVGDPKVGKALNQLEDVQCPECGTRMLETADERQTHIWFEECPSCQGIWLDAGEFTDLKYDTLLDRVKSLLQAKRSDAR
ncbi:MAG: zf-TFIIB domain-containing protein [Pseudomonadales bacterium]